MALGKPFIVTPTTVAIGSVPIRTAIGTAADHHASQISRLMQQKRNTRLATKGANAGMVGRTSKEREDKALKRFIKH